MVIFFERHANIIKSANCISLSLYASYNAGFFILHLGAYNLYNTANVLFQGVPVMEKQEEDDSLIPMFLTELILTVQSLLFEPSLEDFLVCVSLCHIMYNHLFGK